MGEDSIKRKLVLFEVDLKIRFSPSRSPGTKSPVCGIPWYASARANVFFRRFLQPFSDTKLSYLLICIAEDSIKRKLVLFGVNLKFSLSFIRHKIARLWDTMVCKRENKCFLSRVSKVI